MLIASTTDALRPKQLKLLSMPDWRAEQRVLQSILRAARQLWDLRVILVLHPALALCRQVLVRQLQHPLAILDLRAAVLRSRPDLPRRASALLHYLRQAILDLRAAVLRSHPALSRQVPAPLQHHRSTLGLQAAALYDPVPAQCLAPSLQLPAPARPVRPVRPAFLRSVHPQHIRSLRRRLRPQA